MREEIAKWNQMTALRFQTGGDIRHPRPPFGGATARHYAFHTKTMLRTGNPCQDPAGNRTTRRPPDNREETQIAVVWSCFTFIRSGQNQLARHSERRKKTRQTEERGGKTTSGNGQAWSSPGQRGQRRTEENGGGVICGAPTTLAVKE